MLKNYLKLSLKILGRRKFFTFVSLFGIGFTLLVLTLAAAMLDHIFSSYPPETRGERTLVIDNVRMQGKDSMSTGPGGYALAFMLAAPFVIASLIYNLALGAINRAMPALMVSMIGAPALTLGALALMAVATPVILAAWLDAFSDHLARPFAVSP